MYTVDKIIKDNKLINSINNSLKHKGLEAENTVFLDIETTGLSSRNSMCFLIGLLHFDGNNFLITNLFCEKYDEEFLMYLTLNAILKSKKNLSLISFNGDTFDIPFINKRAHMLGLGKEQFLLLNEDFNSIDLLKHFRKYAKLLNLENLKQKTIESSLSINRTDSFSGKEVINLYKEFIAFKDIEKRELILLHNQDDLIGMTALLDVLNYSDLTKLELKDEDISLYNTQNQLCIAATLDFKLLKDLDYKDSYLELKVTNNDLDIKINIVEKSLKHFYSNYKDYYYIPSEDKAIHKSVATYIDKDFREKATKENCYVTLNSQFLPVFNLDSVNLTLFKEDYSSNVFFIQMSDFYKITKGEYIKDILESTIEKMRKK